MPIRDEQARLDEAFERIEETILPCIAMMLETLIDASEAVERSSPMHVEPGEYKTRVA